MVEIEWDVSDGPGRLGGAGEGKEEAEVGGHKEECEAGGRGGGVGWTLRMTCVEILLQSSARNGQ